MSFEFDLSDRLISGELRRAEELSVGLPRAAGINAPTKIVKQTIRFPDYHEPLDRSVPILWFICFLSKQNCKRARFIYKKNNINTFTGKLESIYQPKLSNKQFYFLITLNHYLNYILLPFEIISNDIINTWRQLMTSGLLIYTANVFPIKTTAQKITGFLQGFPVRITEKPYVFCGETL